MEKKRCRKCKKLKHLLEFPILSGGNTDSFCKECKNTIKTELPKAAKNRIKEKVRKGKYLEKKYEMNMDTYNLMVKTQKSCCAICKTHRLDLKEDLFVDHCHKTGQVRRLLCHNCNASLGLLKENITTLENMIDYIKIFNQLNKDIKS